MADPKSPEENRDRTLSISVLAKSRRNPNSPVFDITTSKPRLKGSQSYKQFQELIIEKAKKGTIVRLLCGSRRLALRILPGADERGLDGRAGGGRSIE